MKKQLTFLLFAIFSTLLSAQTITFEDLTLPSNSWWVGADGSSEGFESNNAYFPTVWEPSSGGYWSSGFAYSNMTDSVTSGYLNMFSTKAATGYQDSENYAIAYGDGWFRPGPIDGIHVYEPLQVYVTNNTYAFNSMRDGDQYAKKFGGVTGNDPDFFSVTFTGLRNGEATGAPVTVYLADFRFTDNTQDYILRDWTPIDLTPLGLCDTVIFSFESTDVGDFGINTPLYFCLDNLQINTNINGVNDAANLNLTLYPNPSTTSLQVQKNALGNGSYTIYSVDGALVTQGILADDLTSIPVSSLTNGLYLIKMNMNQGVLSRTFVVQH
jgi:hypothetical protein